MTTYKTLTATDIQTIQNTFSNILPKDMNSQIKTFPTKSVFDGIKEGLSPLEIGNNAYKEMAALNPTQFEDVDGYDTQNWARFCQAAIQTVLNDLIQSEEEQQEEIVEDVDGAKVTAKATLNAYANAEDYTEENQAVLASAISDGETAIDNATTIAEVESALADAKAAIDLIEKIS